MSNPIFLSEKTYFTSNVPNMFWATILYKYHVIYNIVYHVSFIRWLNWIPCNHLNWSSKFDYFKTFLYTASNCLRNVSFLRQLFTRAQRAFWLSIFFRNHGIYIDIYMGSVCYVLLETNEWTNKFIESLYNPYKSFKWNREEKLNFLIINII